MTKALGLVSGGLDSSLAVMTLKRQGIEVSGIVFETPFFTAAKARQAAAVIDFPLIVMDIGPLHLEMVKQPHYGYGRNMNPCIDCHAMMFRLAGEQMAAEGFDFLFSGEVLGQRPMSQNAQALRSVANLSGFPDQVLRPLSAQRLPITPMEEQGLVDRAQLLDLQGRSRKPQQALAAAWGYHDYPASGGGCLLTEKGFSNQLRDLLQHHPQATVNDVELLKIGRQFRLSAQAKLVVGRNLDDNTQLEQRTTPQMIRLRCRNFSGPLGLICGAPSDQDLHRAAAIVASYGKGKDEAEVEILCLQGEREFSVRVAPMPRQISRKLLVA
jgi:tRNA U34 2-thiouridine synthase MnmA/TrmU